MKKFDEIIVRDTAKEIARRCKKAQSQSLAVRAKVFVDVVVFLAEYRINQLEKQLRALAVVTRDRVERSNNHG
jgi:hypothetical protein